MKHFTRYCRFGNMLMPYWTYGANNHILIDPSYECYGQYYADRLHFPRTLSLVPTLKWVDLGAQNNFICANSPVMQR